ncbi:GHMP kinase [Ramlibacter sp. G-1-2-2]|uniref:GHMP kinase n=1 Tax=Ramlibacter agri TaxID=2728837 RepID=A0A848H1U3_9BURK|nr:GHMP kinase [Ramlibacter agri]NML42703.1 GHMP kinase [Ramlibacter agri]
MIIIRTPLRVSFFGGGTDFPEFFAENGGAVLGTAINKYIYHTVSHLPSWLFDHKIRFSYRKVELAPDLDSIEHRPFREILRYCGVHQDVEVNLASDLPSFSGLGSSSSFTVGLIKGLHALQGRCVGNEELARCAIHIEREVLQETVGLQDQVFAAYGGLNIVQFSGRGDFNVERIAIGETRLRELNDSMLLYFTGRTRHAQEVEKAKLDKLADNRPTLRKMLGLVDKAHGVLTGSGSLAVFAQLLNDSWVEKRKLDASVSNPEIDKLYDLGMTAGALGGKLLGAGGGGFMLLLVPPERQTAVRAALRSYHEVPIGINAAGSTVVHA